MKSIKTLALVLFLVCLAGTTAFAMRHGATFGHEGKHARHIEQYKDALGLNAEQESEITKILAERQEMSMTQREERRKIQTALRNISSAENIDEEQIKALTLKQAELHAQMLMARQATQAKINRLLTPEQQAKHGEMRQQRMAKKGKRGCGSAPDDQLAK